MNQIKSKLSSTEELICLDGSRAPYPPSPAVAAAVQDAGRAIKANPMPLLKALRRELARSLDLPESRLFIGRDLLFLCVILFFGGGRTVCADESAAVWRCACALGIDTDSRGERNAVELCGGDLFDAVARMSSASSTLLVDERDSWRYSPDLPTDERLVVLRCFSRRYSLCGAAVEYAIASPRRVRAMERLNALLDRKQCDAVSCAAAIAALRDECYAEKLVSCLERTRDSAAEKLRALGFSTGGENAPFIELAHPSVSPERLASRLYNRGIAVYNDGFRARAYAGSEGDMDRLCYSLRAMMPSSTDRTSRGFDSL